MKTKIITIVLLIVTLTLWLVWDVFVATNEAKGDTISELTLYASYLAPFIPAAWGIICGHLFWPMKEITYKWPRIYVMWGYGSAFGAACIFGAVPGNMVSVPILFLSHFLIGHFMWPQKVRPPKSA